MDVWKFLPNYFKSYRGIYKSKMAIPSRLCCQPFLRQHLWSHTRNHCILPCLYSHHAFVGWKESMAIPSHPHPIRQCRNVALRYSHALSDAYPMGNLPRTILMPSSSKQYHSVCNHSQFTCPRFKLHSFGFNQNNRENLCFNRFIFSNYWRDSFGRQLQQFSSHARTMFKCNARRGKRFGYQSRIQEYGSAAAKEAGSGPLSPDSTQFKCYIDHLRKEHQSILDTLQVCFQSHI